MRGRKGGEVSGEGGGAGSDGETSCGRRGVADDGATVRVRVGQVVAVVLDSGGMMWDPPRSSGRAVRRTAARGGYPTTRPARARFLAIRPGKSALTSVTDARCLHAVPRCEIPQRVWSVTVLVRG